jgi:hypothetical protein
MDGLATANAAAAPHPSCGVRTPPVLWSKFQTCDPASILCNCRQRAARLQISAPTKRTMTAAGKRRQQMLLQARFDHPPPRARGKKVARHWHRTQPWRQHSRGRVLRVLRMVMCTAPTRHRRTRSAITSCNPKRTRTTRRHSSFPSVQTLPTQTAQHICCQLSNSRHTMASAKYYNGARS